MLADPILDNRNVMILGPPREWVDLNGVPLLLPVVPVQANREKYYELKQRDDAHPDEQAKDSAKVSWNEGGFLESGRGKLIPKTIPIRMT